MHAFQAEDGLKSVLRIGSAHNKRGGGGGAYINFARISHRSNFLWIATLACIQTRAVLDIQLVYHILRI